MGCADWLQDEVQKCVPTTPTETGAAVSAALAGMRRAAEVAPYPLAPLPLQVQPQDWLALYPKHFPQQQQQRQPTVSNVRGQQPGCGGHCVLFGGRFD